MVEKDISKEFILEFFKDCKIKEEKGVLTISDVPKDFENFVGKKAPYVLVFDFNLHNKIKDSELIMQGSYFLLAIRDYLNDKGQTSLLKINIKADEQEIKKLKIKNSKIIDIKPSSFEYLTEFSFLSIYQYLNEKKQSITPILVKEKEVLDLDMTKIKTQNGVNSEVGSIDLVIPYNAAKNKLNSNISKEIKPIKVILKKKLEKELLRVKDHYSKQIKEKDDEVERCAEKIKMLKGKLKHTYYDRDIAILNRLIREANERLENLKKRTYKERLKTEEKFHITDEIEKHVLAIKNNLINVTLFYYPSYELVISSKGKTSSVRYDPLFKKII